MLPALSREFDWPHPWCAGEADTLWDILLPYWFQGSFITSTALPINNQAWSNIIDFLKNQLNRIFLAEPEWKILVAFSIVFHEAEIDLHFRCLLIIIKNLLFEEVHAAILMHLHLKGDGRSLISKSRNLPVFCFWNSNSSWKVARKWNNVCGFSSIPSGQ